jgi:site-specific recombinase XerD
MEIVQPIRNKRDIERMKKALGNPRDKLLFTFGINSGLRISDILKLTVGDVRDKSGLTLRETKTRKGKTFRFNDAILSAVKSYINGADKKLSDSDCLFQSRKQCGAISRIQAYRILNDAAERIGLTEPIGTHTLRKTFGYHAYKAGVDLSLLQTIFNHSSQSETLKYIGITQDTVDDVYISVNL